MEQSITKYILFEYLAGRATPLEKQATDEWLKKPDSTEQFHQWLLEWELQSPQFLPDADSAFVTLLSRIEEQDQDDLAEPFHQSTLNRFLSGNWLMAASLVLTLSLGAWLFRKPLLYRSYNTEYGQTSSFVLSDGSRVTLNANSILWVPRLGFDTGAREVELEGEAEFSIRHTSDNRRFVVKTSDTFQVEVLGTEFSVFARSRGTKVALTQGKIRLDYTQGTNKKQLLMKPGERVTMDQKGDLTLEADEDPAVESAWKEQRFVFNNTSVQEICQLLEENFGVMVRANDPEIAARTITGNFKAQTAEDLLDVLKAVLNLEIRKERKTLLLLNPNLHPKI